MEKQLIAKIDRYLCAPEYTIRLYSHSKETIHEEYDKNKRVFIFDFTDLQSLIYYLEHGKVNISIQTLTWNEWDNCKIDIGKHQKVLLQGKNTHNGIALMIFAGDYCCSVTGTKLE